MTYVVGLQIMVFVEAGPIGGSRANPALGSY